MNILRYSVFTNYFGFFFHNFFDFLTPKNKPSRSRRSVSGIKEKCVRGQGEVRRGSRKSASRVKEKCFRWIPHIQLKHFSLTPDALFLDPWRTFSWPRRTYPWPLAHFSLTPDALILYLEGLFSELKKEEKMVKEKSKIIFESARYIS